MRIQFQDLSNGRIEHGVWQGDPAEALEAAVSFLGAEYDAEAEAWVYQAPESGETISVDEDDLLEAGAAILSGAEDWYSIWCAEHGAPVGR